MTPNTDALPLLPEPEPMSDEQAATYWHTWVNDHRRQSVADLLRAVESATADAWRAYALAALAAQQGAQVPQGADAESRAMFVARLENMQENGDHWLTVASVLALLNDCDYLASRSSSPQAPAQPDRHRHASEPYSRGRRKPLCEGGTVWFRGECGECDLAAVNIFTTPARPAPQAKPSKSEDKGR